MFTIGGGAASRLKSSLDDYLRQHWKYLHIQKRLVDWPYDRSQRNLFEEFQPERVLHAIFLSKKKVLNLA